MAQSPVKTHSVVPDAFVVFFPYSTEATGDLEESEAVDTKKPLVVRSDIQFLTTSKSKGGAGRFQMTIAPSENFKSIIQVGTWCMIYMSNEQMDDSNHSDMNSGLKMLGIVRSVRVTEETSPDGAQTVKFDVSGDDFQSVLTTQIYVNATLRTFSDGQGDPVVDSIILLGKQFDVTMGPALLVQTLLNNLLGSSSNGARIGVPYQIPAAVCERLGIGAVDDNLFVEALQKFIQPNLVGLTPVQPDMGSLFSLWSLLETYSHRILNEIYTDLMPCSVGGKTLLLPSFVHRAIPFSSKKATIDPSTLSIKDAASALSPFNNLKGIGDQLYVSKFIEEGDILSMNYGKSDGERFNFFLVTSVQSMLGPQGDAIQLNNITRNGGGLKELADVASIARFGLRPYIASSNFIVAESPDNVLKANKIVRDMWKSAYLYENGQVTLVGNKQHIPVGTNIVFKDRNTIAHVESVSNTYYVSIDGKKTFRTNVAFVRLQSLGGKPVSTVEDESGKRGEWDRGEDDTRFK